MRATEEDDVEARDQHAGRQVALQVRRVLGPAQRGEGHQAGREPGIEHVGVARQRAGHAGGAGLFDGFGLVVGDEHLAVFRVPGGDLVAPPQLARDAPVLDVVEPLVVDGGPVVGVELDAAVGHDFQRHLGDALARVQRAFGRRLAHGDEPLVGQHGFQHHAGAVALGLHHLVRLDLDQELLGFQLGDHCLAGLVALHALELLGAVLVDVGVQREDHDHGQIVAQRAGVVVEVVRASDLDAAGAEFGVDEIVGDDGDVAVAQRQLDQLADQVLVARVFRMHAERAVGQHGLGARGGDGQAAQRDALAVLVGDGLRAVDEGVEDVPHVAVGFLGHHFQVGHGRQQLGIPVDQALAAVDQALFMQAHEGLDHAARHALVHGEVLARPVGGRAQAADLSGDRAAGLFLPFPDFSTNFSRPRSWRETFGRRAVFQRRSAWRCRRGRCRE